MTSTTFKHNVRRRGWTRSWELGGSNPRPETWTQTRRAITRGNGLAGVKPGPHFSLTKSFLLTLFQTSGEIE